MKIEGEIYLTIILWTLSGLAGLTIRFFLLTKYLGDLGNSRQYGLPPIVQKLSLRNIYSTWAHVLVKFLIVIIGFYAAWNEVRNPSVMPPNLVLSSGLVAIPWILTLDGIQNWRYQRQLLRMVLATEKKRARRRSLRERRKSESKGDKGDRGVTSKDKEVM